MALIIEPEKAILNEFREKASHMQNAVDKP